MNREVDIMNNKEVLEISQMIEIATLYYEYDMTQSEIAKRYYISRTKVSRILTKARELGIVEIKVNRLLNRNYYLEDYIKEKYNLKKVFLYDGSTNQNGEIMKGAVTLAGEYLEQRITEKMIVGISWGYTVSKAIDEIENTINLPISVVEIMGFASMANPLENGNNLANKLASKYNGYVYNMNSPLFVDLDVKEKLLKDPAVSRALSIANKADLILTSLGILDFEPTSSLWTGYMTNEMLNELKDQGAVGSIGARFFDRNGKILKNEWDKHCIGIKLEDIKKVDEVAVVAGGIKKSDAIIGALRGGFIDILISDSNTIKNIVDL